MWIAHTIDDCHETQHATVQEAKTAAKARMAGIPGCWTAQATGDSHPWYEHGDDGELNAVVFNSDDDADIRGAFGFPPS